MLNYLDGALGNIPFQCLWGRHKGAAMSVPKGPGKVSADTSALPGIKQVVFTLLCPSDPL